MKYIELTKIEYEAIMESRYEGFMRKHGINITDSIRKRLRYIDLLEKQRKRGVISDQKYKEKINKIINDSKYKYDERHMELLKDYASKKNRENYDKDIGMRPDKVMQTTDVTKSSFKRNPNRTNIDLSSLSPHDKHKVERQIKILQSTDDYNEYCNHYKSLAKMLKIDPEDALGVKPGPKVFSFKAGEDLGRVKDKDIYHTANKNDKESLRPSYRGTGYMLYPRNRIYGSEDRPINKNGSDHIDNKAVYKLKTNNPNLKFKRDKEYEDKVKSGYIETDDKIPVKQIKKKSRL